MVIHGQVAGRQRTGVLEEVAGHPVELIGGRDIAYLLAEDVPVELGAAFARGADVGDGEARVVRHGDQRGLAVARVALKADLFRVDCLVGFEVVEAAAGAPAPGLQRAPVVEFARLALVARPMMPLVRPAPLSSCTLVGMYSA